MHWNEQELVDLREENKQLKRQLTENFKIFSEERKNLKEESYQFKNFVKERHDNCLNANRSLYDEVSKLKKELDQARTENKGSLKALVRVSEDNSNLYEELQDYNSQVESLREALANANNTLECYRSQLRDLSEALSKTKSHRGIPDDVLERSNAWFKLYEVLVTNNPNSVSADSGLDTAVKTVEKLIADQKELKSLNIASLKEQAHAWEVVFGELIKTGLASGNSGLEMALNTITRLKIANELFQQNLR